MKTFGGPVLVLDRSDINTDEIIPAKYLAEISKTALKPHLLEDLLIDGEKFNNTCKSLEDAKVIISRENFGCGSSREHAVWAFEVNDITVIIARSFARIFRQNMFNCGILALELDIDSIEQLISMEEIVNITVNLKKSVIEAKVDDGTAISNHEFTFVLNDFDRDLISAGGWLEYAEENY